MSSWLPIDTAPPNTPILIKYYKGGKNSRTRVTKKWIVTQAKAVPLYLHELDRPENPLSDYSTSSIPWSDSWKVTPSEYFAWVDGLDRLIVNTSSKVQKNVVEFWQHLPV